MRAILVGTLAASVLLAFAGAGSAEPNVRKHRRDYDDLVRQYPYATQRQLNNERAYRRGEYYERDSNALIPGTQAWFEQKERESGDRR